MLATILSLIVTFLAYLLHPMGFWGLLTVFAASEVMYYLVVWGSYYIMGKITNS